MGWPRSTLSTPTYYTFPVMDTYKTFTRSATNFEEMRSARKTTRHTGKTYEEAQKLCEDFNKNRTPAQIRKGTKLEFTRE
jgi:hypothetical protein